MFCVLCSLPPSPLFLTMQGKKKSHFQYYWFSVHTGTDFVLLPHTVTRLHQCARGVEEACPELRAEYQGLTSMCF